MSAAASSLPSGGGSREEESLPAGAPVQGMDAHDNRAPPPTLYKHALESVFAFLALRDLSRVLAVSLDWSAAVGSMRPIGATNLRPHSVSAVCASHLARHISRWTSDVLSVSSEGLSLLSLTMRSLHTLECTLTEPRSDAAIVFPPKLTRLTLTVDYPSSTVVNAVIQSIRRRLPLLQSLKLALPQPSALSFAPLQSLPHLTEFEFKWPNMDKVDHKPTDAQIDQIRAMRHLTRPPFPPSTDQLCRLLRSPHSLHWQSISESSFVPVDAKLSLLLPSLPSLTQLYADLLADCDPAFFSRLTNLTELRLSLSDFADASTWDSLAFALQSCTNITDLTLDQNPLTSAQMSMMLSHFINLRTLVLREATALESLRFLSSGPITPTLTQLSLINCQHPQLQLSEMAHVHSLQSLTCLELEVSFVEPMDELTRSLYAPPSLLLPKLVEFLYFAP